MKNKIGFIPKTKNFPVQPDYYSKIFNNYNAVFLTDSGKEYHIESTDGFLEVLEALPTGRVYVAHKVKTLKEAYEKLLQKIKFKK